MLKKKVEEKTAEPDKALQGTAESDTAGQDTGDQQASQKEPVKSRAKSRKKSARQFKINGLTFFIINIVISIAIAATVGIISYNGWNKLQQQKDVLASQQQKLQQILTEQKTIADDVRLQLQQNSLQQNTELSTLKETIAAFLKQNQHSRRDWLIAEAEYLVKLANHRLILASDIPTSIQALMAADDRLREVGNPKYIPLRQALAADIQTLNNIPRVDTVGLSLKLNALQKQVETLPLSTPDPASVKQRKEEALNVSQVDNWKQLPAAIWNDLLKLFRIQQHNEVIKPLLLPEQHFYLVQNLKLKLEQARLALLNSHPVIYKDRLEQSKQWINQYFDIKHDRTIALIKMLDELISSNIQQQLPDLSDSLSKLQLLHPTKKPLKPVAIKKRKKNNSVKNKPVQSKSVKKKSTKKKAVQKKPAVKQKPVSKTKETQQTKPEENTSKKETVKPLAAPIQNGQQQPAEKDTAKEPASKNTVPQPAHATTI